MTNNKTLDITDKGLCLGVDSFKYEGLVVTFKNNAITPHLVIESTTKEKKIKITSGNFKLLSDNSIFISLEE